MMFSSQIYRLRRRNLCQQLQQGIVLLPANGYSIRNYVNNTYPFRQDSTFLYYCGISIPDVVLLIDTEEESSILFADEITPMDVIWSGPREKIIDLAGRVGIEKVIPYSDLASYLEPKISSHTPIHYLPPYKPNQIIKLSHWLNLPTHEIEQKYSIPLIRAVVNNREIKSKDELIEIESALDITHTIHSIAMNMAQEKIAVSEILGTITKEIILSETEFAYPPILTVNGQILHNHDYSNILSSNNMLLADIGAESKMSYASDITRTTPVGLSFSGRQKDIYNIVLKAQKTAISALKPEIPFKDIHVLASEVIAKGLNELGLMKGDPVEAVKEGAHALFFPHGLGHMMGLDVHDMEHLGEDFVGYDETFKRSSQFGLKSLRLGKKLKEHFVVTVEPGIYFIPDLISAWKKEKKWHSFIHFDKLESYKNFGGIRIEDNLVITNEGAKILGKYIEKDISNIEQ